jgi:hypothetical protein
VIIISSSWAIKRNLKCGVNPRRRSNDLIGGDKLQIILIAMLNSNGIWIGLILRVAHAKIAMRLKKMLRKFSVDSGRSSDWIRGDVG